MNLNSTATIGFGPSKTTRNGGEKRENQEAESCGRSASDQETGNGQSKGEFVHVIFSIRLTTFQLADAVKRYSYLLGQTELFKHFVDIKVVLSSFLTDSILIRSSESS